MRREGVVRWLALLLLTACTTAGRGEPVAWGQASVWAESGHAEIAVIDKAGVHVYLQVLVLYRSRDQLLHETRTVVLHGKARGQGGEMVLEPGNLRCSRHGESLRCSGSATRMDDVPLVDLTAVD